MLKQIFLVLCFMWLAYAQQSTVEEVTLTNRAQCPESAVCDRSRSTDSESSVRKCITYMSHLKVIVELDNRRNSTQYYGFCVRVDEFAMLTIQRGYDYMATNRNSTIRIYAGAFASERRFFFNVQNITQTVDPSKFDHMASFYTAIVQMDGGLVKERTSGNLVFPGVAWENSCDPTLDNPTCTFDPTATCIRKLDCAVESPPTVSSNSKSIKIYLAFQGTDSAGNPLKSASFTPARYRQYAWAGYYGSLTKTLLPKTN